MESLTVVISDFTDNILRLNFNCSTTIQDVMFKLRDCTKGFDRYILLFEDLNLLDYPSTHTLFDHGVRDQDKLILTEHGFFDVQVVVGGQPRSGESHTYPVKTLTLPVKTLQTVGMLKHRLHAITGIPVESQELFYCFNPMGDDGATLATCGIYKCQETESVTPSEKKYYGHIIYLQWRGCTCVYELGKRSILDFVQSPAGLSNDSPTPLPLEAASSGDTNIVVNVSTSIGNIRLRLKGNLKDTISTVKTMLHEKVSSLKADNPLSYIVEGMYVLLFNRKELEDVSLTLEQCGIKDQEKMDDRFVVCPKANFVLTVLLVRGEEPGIMQVHGVPIRCFDTVATLKTKIREVANIYSEMKILLKFEEKWLDEKRCLVEYGIVEYPYIDGIANYYLCKKGICIVEAFSYASPAAGI